MHHFFDPSIKPIVVTDLSDKIIAVRTFGLEHYGYPNLIMYEVFRDYETLFYMILDSIFSLEFDTQKIFMFNNNEVKFTLDKQNNAIITMSKQSEVKITTYRDPFSQEIVKHKTKGLSELFGLPEVEISGTENEGIEILAYVVNELNSGAVIDDSTSIEIEGNFYELTTRSDRFGNSFLEISKIEFVELKQQYRQKNRIKMKEGLRRIK
ncbi:hypothetical protein C0Q44_28525 [Paenibacillus sp. PCH8]|uniref:hypothetical protein n=1 Tax=Paenibacillus sp. PCH8 TaxID=2066524 RepID=UPI000CF8E931|nr:hypothetical protein [Paenibacillus sp. PCH8]PQP80359.1 hypothetical protein C0Q44_28525 [Paenibacillus sp. PCH8]